MQVAKLIELLRGVPQDAHVTVMGEIVHGLEVVRGTVEVGYYNPQFRIGKGRESAIRFLRNSELSTGEVEQLPT